MHDEACEAPVNVDARRLVQIVEIRRLAHGIYPALLISDGLPEALPTLAARSAVPAQLDLHGVGRYPAPIEAMTTRSPFSSA